MGLTIGACALAISLGVGMALAVAPSSGEGSGLPTTTTTTPPPTTTTPAGATQTFLNSNDLTAAPGESFTAAFQVMGADPINGTVTVSLYGPDDADCSQAPVSTEDVPVTTSGALYSTAPTSVGGDGLYRWTAKYNGNRGNLASNTECGQDGSTVFVSGEPTILEMRVVPRKFTPTDENQPLGPDLPGRGQDTNFPAQIKLTTNYDGVVHFAFRKSTSKPAPSNGAARRGFNAEVRADGDAVPITGKLRGKKLKPGRYTLKARPVDDSGDSGEVASAPFRIPLP